MSNIVVISDSHNRLPKTEKFLSILDEADYIFFLGDGGRDIDFLTGAYRSKLHYVYGNCDFRSGRREELVEIDGVKFFLTHGHDYGVKSGLLNLDLSAKEKGADCALFGHTHRPIIEKSGLLTLINPGSIGYDDNYCYMSVYQGRFAAKLVTLTNV